LNNRLRFRLGVVILAAGASRRMGRPKLLLPWGDGTILAHLLGQWPEADAIAVVCAGSSAVTDELDRLGFSQEGRILNPDPERGMFSSIEEAARWKAWPTSMTHVVLSLGDQPHLLPATLSGLIAFAREHPDHIVQPSHQGRLRHPVVFPFLHWRALADSAAGNLKRFLEERSDQRKFWECGDAGLDLDLDFPADYERACGLASGIKSLRVSP
jgi:molybdenum cofactor cytidylyltransferase